MYPPYDHMLSDNILAQQMELETNQASAFGESIHVIDVELLSFVGHWIAPRMSQNLTTIESFTNTKVEIAVTRIHPTLGECGFFHSLCHVPLPDEEYI